ncbi:MAG TPA: glycosyltransferase [Thermoanaerobaculia bacterium]|nr:glycosyltransferase [Thermoanaerobaculia bacterium]
MLRAGLVSIDPEQKWIGGRYYLHHLVRSVAALPPEERVALFDLYWQGAPDDDPFAEVRPLLAGRRVIELPQRFGPRLRRKLRRSLRGWSDARDLFLDAGIDVIFPIAPCESAGIPFVFWIPDFQYRRLPELFSTELHAWYERHNLENARAADRIVVSSEEGRRDLEQYLPQFAEKTRVLHFCSVPTDEWWALEPAAVAQKHALPDKFFVLSNQFSHHKNHMVAFEALRLLRDAHGIEATIACTGSTYGFRGDDYFARIQSYLREHGLTASARILGLIPRAEQVALMRRSLAMLQPSAFEGWSTIVEDAKSLGKRILLSDIGVHREQAPAGGTFLPLHDPAAWARAMAKAWQTTAAGPHEDEERAGAAHIEAAKIDTGRTFTRILREAVSGR